MTGSNLFFASPGAVLEVAGTVMDRALIAAWQVRVERACDRLGWPHPRIVARPHAGGASLAITAPIDQLFVATEVNEWALCASLVEHEPERWQALEALLIVEASRGAAAPLAAELQPAIDEAEAFLRFARLSALESHPKLRTLLQAAARRSMPYVLDEEQLTLGVGVGGRNFDLDALPDVADVPWEDLQLIPTVIVTGSNGKTTTVRLLAACARRQGWHTAYTCTDGVFLDEEQLATGDYSGPDGARLVMRQRRAQAAILETARGGILRRGIAISQADAAVVTNLSADHFGEYGIHDLDGLAEVKLAVASVVTARGLLVLNADDPRLCAHVAGLARRYGRTPALGWFSVDPDPRSLDDHRSRGDATCGVQDARLHLSYRGEHDLGLISSMPLAMGGVATYNVANLAAAALAASAVGVAPQTIASIFAEFGSNPADNYGRMMRFEIGGVKVLIDYAHNPDGLLGFLKVADHLRVAGGRLGLLLGQAGNRSDADIEELAQVTAPFNPDLVVVKENETQLRGREPGEVPRIIRAALVRRGLPESALPIVNSEIEAARYALDWALPGDVLALPIHLSGARKLLLDLLKTRGAVVITSWGSQPR